RNRPAASTGNEAMKIEIRFAKGDALSVDVLAEAPRTAACVQKALPLDATVYQARWSGREIFLPVRLADKPPRERQSIRANLGDVIYFCEWGDAYDPTGFEAIGLFYGPEIVREWRGDAAVNVFGQIDPSQWDLIKAIRERVWREGGESVSLRLVDG
ncbi:MAG: DUF3830 family protein, partial [Geminicoccales bacterium]